MLIWSYCFYYRNSVRVIGRTGINHFQSSLHFSFCTLYIPISGATNREGGGEWLRSHSHGGSPIYLANCNTHFNRILMIEKLTKLATFTPSVLPSLSVSLYSLTFYLFVFPYTKMMIVILDLMLPPCLILIQDCTCWRRGYRRRENSLNIWTRWWGASPETLHAVSDGAVCVICGGVGGVCVCVLCDWCVFILNMLSVTQLFWCCLQYLCFQKREYTALLPFYMYARVCVCVWCNHSPKL